MKRKTLKSDFYKTSAEQFPQTLNILRIILVFVSLFPPFTFPYENSQTKQINKHIKLFKKKTATMQHLWLCSLTHQIKQTEYAKTTLEQEENSSKQWVQPRALQKCHSLLAVCILIQSIKPLTTNTALWLMGGEKIKTESSSNWCQSSNTWIKMIPWKCHFKYFTKTIKQAGFMMCKLKMN